MIKTADAFGWTERCPGDPYEGYAVAMARDLAPEQLLERLDAHPADPPRITGAEALHRRWMDEWDPDIVVGAFTAGGWTVAFEPSGYLLADADVLARLSVGTRLVAHSNDVNGHDHFHWFQDGDLRLHVKPFAPEQREGSAADDLVDAMRAMGFAFAFAEDEGEQRPIAKAFALAEHITGVPLTAETFEEAVYLLGVVED
ncbi:DUF6461 domain-containing protein [Spirillospora sp. NPDC050679]